MEAKSITMSNSTKEVLAMKDAKSYKELQVPKGGAKAFAAALAEMNDDNAPARKKKPATAKKKPSPKKK